MPAKFEASASDLPSYINALDSRRACVPKAERSCSLESKGRRWLYLIVDSHSRNPASLPVFLEGDVISGRVELDLDKAETIKGITIGIHAGTTFVGQEESVFLEINQSLWSPANGELAAKLKGKYTWPFKISLPSEVDVAGVEGSKRTYQLPPNFSERAGPAYIDYKLIVTVKRGFLHVNQTLMTGFGYRPFIQAGLPSVLRQLSYAEMSPLLGPEGDPAGWKVFPAITLEGTLFNAKPLKVNCFLAIATPLCYSTGSPIPIILTFTSRDTQALDVVANHSAVRMRLARTIITGIRGKEGRGNRTDNQFSESVGQGYFWSSAEGKANAKTRVLQGEIEVGKTLKPSFVFPRITLRYTLDLLAFEAPGFVSNNQARVLLSEEVEVATKQAPGVVPRSYAPPGYEKPGNVDYNKSVGLLENGNQRFYHHHGQW